MLKEIYISTEGLNPFNVRAIEIQEVFRVLNLIYYYGCEGKDRPERYDYRSLFASESVVLDVYGYPWEGVVIGLLDHAEIADTMAEVDFPYGTLCGKMFQTFADFCRKHYDKGNIVVIG